MSSKISKTAIVRKNYIIRVSAANMPNSCWGRYVRTAVLEVDPGINSVPAIDARCRGVVRIVACFGPSNVGRTARAADVRDYAACEKILAEQEAKEEERYAARVDRAAAQALAERSGEEL